MRLRKVRGYDTSERYYQRLLVFPLIAAVFTAPYAVFQYNRHGKVSKYRTLIIYSFVLYMLVACFLVTLPLPDKESTVINIEAHGTLITILLLLQRAYFYWYFINAVFLKGRPMPHDKLSKTRYVIIQKEE